MWGRRTGGSWLCRENVRARRAVNTRPSSAEEPEARHLALDHISLVRREGVPGAGEPTGRCHLRPAEKDILQSSWQARWVLHVLSVSFPIPQLQFPCAAVRHSAICRLNLSMSPDNLQFPLLYRVCWFLSSTTNPDHNRYSVAGSGGKCLRQCCFRSAHACNLYVCEISVRNEAG